MLQVPQGLILHLVLGFHSSLRTRPEAVCFGAAAIKSGLQGEEILQELLTRLRKHRLWMELDAFQFVPPVAHAHDDPVVGLRSDRKLARQ